MGLFSGTKDKVKFVEPAFSAESRGEVFKIAKETDTADIPLQGVSELTDLEQQAVDLAGEFMRDSSGEVTIDKAIAVATEIAERQIDLNSPEIQGIIQEVRKTGDLALNRIGRQLQKQGSLSTTAGRDIAGRSISETENRIAGVLQPILSNFRAQRLNATSLLPGLVGSKSGTTQNRIATGANAGGLIRSIQDRIKEALFNRESSVFDFNTVGRANLFSSLIKTPQAVVTAGGPSELSKIAGVTKDISSIGALLAGIPDLTGGSKSPSGGGELNKTSLGTSKNSLQGSGQGNFFKFN